jgi:hypothetical protein
MKKLEKIKEAYGKTYERYSEFIDKNGWIKKLSLIKDFEVCEVDFVGSKQRPKLLQGIEHNNGWIYIESEVDLPDKDIECYVTNRIGRIQFGEFEKETERFFVNNDRIFPTHYQQVIKPKHPIY